MAKLKLFFVGDEVRINLSKSDNAVTNGMLKYNGKIAKIDKQCRAISTKRKHELDEKLKDLRTKFRNSDKEFVKVYEFDILNNLREEDIGAFKRLITDNPMKALALEIGYWEDMIIRLWAPYGYELEDVVSPKGIPYTFMNHMLEPVEKVGE